MTGTVLQQNKYKIQELLYQGDFESTYRATHVLLNQPVVVQTLNPVLQQRSDFAQIRQQFLQRVRSLAKLEHPTVRVVDSFVESDRPFLVLAYQPDLPPPKLNQWLTLPPEPNATGPETIEFTPELPPQPVAAQSNSSQPIAAQPVVTKPSGTVTTQPGATQPVVTKPGATKSGATQPASPMLPQMPSLNAQSASLNTRSFFVFSPDTSPQLGKGWGKLRHNFWLVLGGVALVGVSLGAGMGLSIRRQTLSNDAGAPIGNSWFRREQSFPAQNQWPVTESPYATPTDPNAEVPLYLTAPALEPYSVPDYVPPASAEDPTYAPPSYPAYGNSPLPVQPAPAPTQATPIAPREPIALPPAAPSEPAPAAEPLPLENNFDLEAPAPAAESSEAPAPIAPIEAPPEVSAPPIANPTAP